MKHIVNLCDGRVSGLKSHECGEAFSGAFSSRNSTFREEILFFSMAYSCHPSVT
jgi:hypothetical protein